MRNRRYWRRFFLIIWSVSLLGAMPINDRHNEVVFLPSLDEQLSETIELIFREDFPTAEIVCARLIENYKNHPAGYFMMGILHWKKGYFLDSYNRYNDHTLDWLNRAIDVAGDQLKRNPNDPVAHFFAGGAYGYKGSVYARRKSWLKTGKAAFKGIRELERAKELDSTLYDIYYGTGLYHVLASHQSGVVKFLQKLLPIPEGDAELGLRHLQMAIQKGRFTSLASKAALAMAYVYYEEKFPEAIQLLTPLVHQYPKNLDFLTTLINAYFYHELECGKTDRDELQRLLDQTQAVIAERGIEFQEWWRDKFVFIDGYLAYRRGDWARAKEKLGWYCAKYDKKGESYLTALGYLTLGKIADLEGLREQAIAFYKEVDHFEQIGNEGLLAARYLATPFTEEKCDLTLTGNYVDLPDKP